MSKDWRQVLRQTLRLFDRAHVEALLEEAERRPENLMRGVHGLYDGGVCIKGCPVGFLVLQRGVADLAHHAEATSQILYPMGVEAFGENEFAKWWDCGGAAEELALEIREYLGSES